MTAPGSRGLALDAGPIRLEVPDGRGRRQRVLDLATLRCSAGAGIALTGPSGSGKTSLLGLLAGLVRPEAGRIAWNGTDLATLSASALDRWRRGHVGLVFQEAELVPELGLLDNLLLPARFARFRVPADLRARALALLVRAGLERPDRRAASLSVGERQRAALARALLLDPPLVLADEPTASLDRDTARSVADLLLEATRESGATLIVATHDLDLAGRFSIRWPLRDGRLVDPAPAAEAA